MRAGVRPRRPILKPITVGIQPETGATTSTRSLVTHSTVGQSQPGSTLLDDVEQSLVVPTQ